MTAPTTRPTTSELRRDPILRRWVIVAPERAGDLAPYRATVPEPASADPCPFCPGAEHLNPTEIARAAGADGWAVRVMPDRHPVLRIEGSVGQRGVGMFDLMNAVGAHELVVDTPSHTDQWADFAPDHMQRLLETYRARTLDLRRDERFRYVLALKNHGAAWSRYSHAHSHVIATPFAPKRIEDEFTGAREYHRLKERCAFCDQIAEELHAATRIVAHGDGFLAFCPFASEHPYEVWVVPLAHAADFGAVADQGLGRLGALLVHVLARLRAVLGDPAYGVALHSGPLDGSHAAAFHWHWEIVPLVQHVLGMEWATGVSSNPVPPETAAFSLRADPQLGAGTTRG
jgi:UDPglucose--hexose-1-phosphate uridylyltransferase